MGIIDLTYGISAQMSKYPSDPPPSIETAPATEKDGKICSAVTTLAIRPHHGTHIDAPSHKIPGGKTMDQYPIDHFVNRAALVNVTSPPSGYTQKITLPHLQSALPEQRIRKLADEGVTTLLFWTGYAHSIETGARDDPWFPYLAPEAAEFLAGLKEKHQLRLNLVGIDSFSVDPKESNSESHRILLAKDILILETLVNLYALNREAGTAPFTLHSAPVIFRGADAAQARAYAMVMRH